MRNLIAPGTLPGSAALSNATPISLSSSKDAQNILNMTRSDILSLRHKFYTQTTNSFKHSPQPTYLPLSRLAPMKLYVLITVAHRFRLPLFIDTHLKNFETFVSRFHPSLISKMLIWIPNILAYAKIRTSSIWQRRQQQSPMQHPFVYRWNRPDQCNLRREDAEKKMDFVMYSNPLQGIQIESEPRPNSVWGSKVV